MDAFGRILPISLMSGCRCEELSDPRKLYGDTRPKGRRNPPAAGGRAGEQRMKAERLAPAEEATEAPAKRNAEGEDASLKG